MGMLQKVITVVFDKNMNLLLRSDPVFDYLFPKLKTLTEFTNFLNQNNFHDEAFLARLVVEGREHHICYRGFEQDETYKFEFFLLDEEWSIINSSGRHDIKDKLTGVLTQKSFFPVLEHEIHRSLRNQEPYTLILIDISNLKDINEAFGYIAGDTVIKSMAELLHSTTRASDSLGRFQGDKFLLLLNNTDLNGAMQYIKKLTYHADKLELDFNDVHFKVQMHYGITAPHENDTIDSLLQRLTENLKQAKSDDPSKIIDF